MTEAVPVPAVPAPAASAADESLLLEALAAGSQAAAEELVERTYRRVYATLCRFSGDAELAADLTQETYRRAWAALPGFDGRARLSTWLHRIAANTFLNHVRGPRRLVPLEAAHDARPDPGPGHDARLERAQEDARLRRAVLELPEPLRDTVAARYWGELPVREIARLDGISGVAVRKRLRKALRLLAAALEEVES